jgi:hypothetical protein
MSQKSGCFTALENAEHAFFDFVWRGRHEFIVVKERTQGDAGRHQRFTSVSFSHPRGYSALLPFTPIFLARGHPNLCRNGR